MPSKLHDAERMSDAAPRTLSPRQGRHRELPWKPYCAMTHAAYLTANLPNDALATACSLCSRFGDMGHACSFGNASNQHSKLGRTCRKTIVSSSWSVTRHNRFSCQHCAQADSVLDAVSTSNFSSLSSATPSSLSATVHSDLVLQASSATLTGSIGMCASSKPITRIHFPRSPHAAIADPCMTQSPRAEASSVLATASCQSAVLQDCEATAIAAPGAPRSPRFSRSFNKHASRTL